MEMSRYFFDFDYKYDPQAEAKNFTSEAAALLTALADRFEKLDDFTHETTEAALGQLAEELEIKKAKLIHPTRLAVSGVPGGPGLYDILVLLTQPVTIERMRKAVTYIEKKQN